MLRAEGRIAQAVLGRANLAAQIAAWAVRPIIIAACLLAASQPHWLLPSDAVRRGDQDTQNGQIASSIVEYDTALKAQPGDTAIMARLADSALAAQRPDLAALFLRQLASLNGWTPTLYRKTAEAFVAEGDRQQASLYWQASLNGTTGDLPTLRNLIDYALDARDWHGAIGMLDRLIEIDPTNQQALYQLGLLTAPTNAQAALGYMKSAAVDPEYRSAAAALDTTIAAHGKDTPAVQAFQIGLTLMGLQAWPYAEFALNTAIEQGDTSAATLAFLGVTQDQQGRDGWPVISRAFNNAPADATVNYAVALHWRLVGDTQKALDALARAEAIDPRNPAVAAEIGMVYQMQGQLRDAALWLNTATNLAPDNPGFRTLLATFYADSTYELDGDGMTAIRKLADESPNDADIQASLGWALFSIGQFDAANTALQRALVLDPTNPRARYYFAALLEYRGDKEGAISAYLYVYQDAGDNGFRDLAAGALRRLGYAVDLNNDKP